MSEARFDKHEEFILDVVARTGWSVSVVSDHQPPFAYSVGLMHSFDHPEIIMFGMDTKLMGSIINGMARMIRDGRRFEEEGLYEGLLEGFAIKMVPVLAEYHTTYLGYAMWHRRHDGKINTLRAVQCLWPEKASGKFPDEPGCHPNTIQRQPLLNRPIVSA